MNILNEDLIGYYERLALLICRNVSENKFAYILQKASRYKQLGKKSNQCSYKIKLHTKWIHQLFLKYAKDWIVCPSDQKVFVCLFVFFSLSVPLNSWVYLLGWQLVEICLRSLTLSLQYLFLADSLSAMCLIMLSTTHCTAPPMMNDRNAGSQNEFLAETTPMQHFQYGFRKIHYSN